MSFLRPRQKLNDCRDKKTALSANMFSQRLKAYNAWHRTESLWTARWTGPFASQRIAVFCGGVSPDRWQDPARLKKKILPKNISSFLESGHLLLRSHARSQTVFLRYSEKSLGSKFEGCVAHSSFQDSPIE